MLPAVSWGTDSPFFRELADRFVFRIEIRGAAYA